MAKNKSKKKRKHLALAHIIEMGKHWSPNNKEVFETQDKQGTKVFEWKCPSGHFWKAKMAQVRSSTLPLCPKCREQNNKRSKSWVHL